MELLKEETFRELAGYENGKCISIYMPTHRGPNGMEEDRIRLKNHIQEAKAMLREEGMDEVNAHKYLKKIWDLYEDDDAWKHMSDGLAVFLSDNYFRYFTVPVSFREETLIMGNFYLKPLMPLFEGDTRFYILAVSQNHVSFYEATKYTLTEIDMRDLIPQSRREALEFTEFEKSLQHHAGMSPMRIAFFKGHGKSKDAIFHGHGSVKDYDKIELETFFRKLANGLEEYLNSNEATPMVFAGVDYLYPMFKKATKYKNLLDEHITGNVEHWNEVVLQRDAWDIAKKHFDKDFEEAKQSYNNLAGTGKATSQLDQLIPAAVGGRVQALFVTPDAERWGVYDKETNTVEVHPERAKGDICLMNTAAVQTVLNGGRVFVIDESQFPDTVNGNEGIAAVMRY